MHTKKTLFVCGWTFAREDCLTGKHLLIANLTMIKTLAYLNSYSTVKFYAKTARPEYIRNLIESFGFELATELEDGHTSYCMLGTGVFRPVLGKYRFARFLSLESALELTYDASDTTYNFNRYASLWYAKVLHFLKEKNVYNIIIDPHFDCTISDFKPLYFCNYYDKHSGLFVNDPNFRVCFASKYIGQIRRHYNWNAVDYEDKINGVFAKFNNARNFSEKRADGVALLVEKGIDIHQRKKDLIFSIDEYNRQLQSHWFSAVTYSYDGETMSMLRLYDAIALGCIPIISVTYEDLCKYVSTEFADLCRHFGLITYDCRFNMDDLINLTTYYKKRIIIELEDALS